MDFYGNINLLDNQMQKMVMQTETSFPDSPKVGRIVFVNKRVFICVEIVTGLPTWVPLTNEINTYIHTQQSASATWTVVHNLNTSTPLVQVYDSSTQTTIVPDEITITDNNVVSLSFGVTPFAGRCVVMYGDVTGGSKTAVAYTHYQTNLSSTWVISHALGYYPVVRVFLNTGEEIQPLTVKHDSLFQTTITFTMGYVGTARLV